MVAARAIEVAAPISPCDSPTVISGRGRTGLVAAAIAIACIVLATTIGAGAAAAGKRKQIFYKGRALLTFVTPATYFVATDPFRPREGHPQTFAEGQAVHIDVEGHTRSKKVLRVGFGFSRAVVQLAPSP